MEIWLRVTYLAIVVVIIGAMMVSKYKILKVEKKKEVKKELAFKAIFTNGLQVVGFILLFVALVFYSKILIYIAMGFIFIGLIVESVKVWKVNKKERNVYLVRALVLAIATIVIVQFIY